MKLGYGCQLAQSVADFQALKLLNPRFPVSLSQHFKNALSSAPARFYRSANAARPIIYDPAGLFFQRCAFVPRLAASQPYRFVTNLFLHGDPIHLYYNLRTLNAILPSLTTTFKQSDALIYATFISSVAFGNLACFFTYGARSITPCVGASGGIFGLMGLLLVTSYRHGTRSLSKSVINNAGYNFLYPIVMSGLGYNTRISQAAHVGGFVSGAVIGFLCR